MENFYKKYINLKLTLADQLAASNSMLTNENTFLAYQRTAITMIVSGFSLIKFFEDEIIAFIGWFFIISSVLVVIIGIYRFHRMKELIISLESDKNKNDLK